MCGKAGSNGAKSLRSGKARDIHVSMSQNSRTQLLTKVVEDILSSIGLTYGLLMTSR